MQFPPGGHPQLAAGIGQPEQGQHLEAIAGIERKRGREPFCAERPGGCSRQKVPDPFFARGMPGIGSRKLTGTASACNSPRRRANSTTSASSSPMPTIPPEQISSPASADRPERIEPILIRVRGADAGIETLAGVEVVVDPIDAARLQPPGLLEARAARPRSRSFSPKAAFTRGTAWPSASSSAIAGRAAGDDGAIGLGLPFGGRPGPVENLIGRKQIVAGDFGLRDPRLGAVAAVFAAQSALGVDQEVQIDAVSEPAMPDSIGGRQQVQQFLVAGPQNVQPVFRRQAIAVEHALGQFVPAAWGSFGRQDRSFTRSVHGGYFTTKFTIRRLLGWQYNCRTNEGSVIHTFCS